MFNHALFLNSGQYCTICLDCLRACPARSPRLILQFPLRDIWQSDLISTDVAPLTVVVALMALLLAAAPIAGSPSPNGNLWFTLGTLAAVAVGLTLQRVFRSPEKAEGNRSVSWAGRAVYAYAPAVAAVLFAFHVLSSPWLDEVSVHIGMVNGSLLGTSLLQIGQGAALALGGLMTLWALWRLCRQRFGPALVTRVAAWIPLALLAVAYLAGGLMLLGRG